MEATLPSKHYKERATLHPSTLSPFTVNHPLSNTASFYARYGLSQLTMNTYSHSDADPCSIEQRRNFYLPHVEDVVPEPVTVLQIPTALEPFDFGRIVQSQRGHPALARGEETSDLQTSYSFVVKVPRARLCCIFSESNLFLTVKIRYLIVRIIYPYFGDMSPAAANAVTVLEKETCFEIQLDSLNHHQPFGMQLIFSPAKVDNIKTQLREAPPSWHPSGAALLPVSAVHLQDTMYATMTLMYVVDTSWLKHPRVDHIQ